MHSIEGPETRIVVSSAKLVELVSGGSSNGKSFICIIKKSGPKMLPCGTPMVTGSESDRVPLN